MSDSVEKISSDYNNGGHTAKTGVRVDTTEIPHADNDDSVERREYLQSLPELPSSKQSPLQYSLHHFWLFEVFALILSILGLVAIFIVLRCTDKRPVPSWKLSVARYDKSTSVTINSVISLFSTLVKSAVLVPVVAGLGELKWLWFTGKDRKLTDVLVFDSAAHGPLGATVLLWKLRGHLLPAIGAIIIIGSLVMDFAFQQLVAYPVRAAVQESIAVIPRANGYNASVPLYHDYRTPETAMIGAIYNGLYNDDKPLPVAPSCSTGNCTWSEVYSSVGVCSRCYDTTALIQKNCGTYNPTLIAHNETGGEYNKTYTNIAYCNYTLPSGQMIDGRNFATPPEGSGLIIWLPTTMVISPVPASNETYFGSPARGDWSFPIPLSILRGKWELGQNDSIEEYHFNLLGANATECGLEYCAIKYNATMNKNNFTEDVIDVWTQKNSNLSTNAGGTGATTSDGMSLYRAAVLTPPASWTNKTQTSDNNMFVVEYEAARAMGDFIYWNGTYIESLDGMFQEGSDEIVNRMRSLDNDGLNRTFQNIAVSMTRRMRISANPHADDARPEVRALGKTLQDTTYVRVRWAWMTLPAVITVFSAVFLVGTFLHARKRGATMLWKSSGLASFYHPLPPEAAQRLGEARDARHAEKIAEEMRVRWQPSEIGGRFVLA